MNNLKALFVVCKYEHSHLLNEMDQIRKENEKLASELQAWKGNVQIPTATDCWRQFNQNEDFKLYGYEPSQSTCIPNHKEPPIMRFIAKVDEYINFSCLIDMDDHGNELHIQYIPHTHQVGPYYVFELPYNYPPDHTIKGPIYLHLKTPELHRLCNPITTKEQNEKFPNEKVEVCLNENNEHPIEGKWFLNGFVYTCGCCP